jgi:hypothetical protein
MGLVPLHPEVRILAPLFVEEEVAKGRMMQAKRPGRILWNVEY